MPTFSHPCVSDHSHAFRSAFVAWGLPIFDTAQRMLPCAISELRSLRWPKETRSLTYSPSRHVPSPSI
jgi:hypothetical protein